MKISSIVAVGPKREIGYLGKMAWEYPHEYQHFINTVSGHCIVMGRVNFEENLSNSRLLARTTSLVVSTSKSCQQFLPSNEDFDYHFFTSIDSAINYARTMGEQELFIIGGEAIYRQTLKIVDRIYYSVVPYKGAADRFFPEIPQHQFNVIVHEKNLGDEKNPPWDFYLYERK